MFRHILTTVSNLYKVTRVSNNAIFQPILKNSIAATRGRIFVANMSCTVNYDTVLKATKNACVYIIDVRDASELQKTGCIPNSINIPLAEVVNTLQNCSGEEFKCKFGREKPGMDSVLIFSCQSGRRATTAADSVTKLGYCKAQIYQGSWCDWEKHLKK